MRAEIEQRIRAVYPTGRLVQPDVAQYFGKDYDDRLWNTLVDAASQTTIQLDSNWAREEAQQNRYGFSLDADPCVLEWVHSSRQEKLRILGERGRNVPIFWLPISRVFPAYYHYYNVWQPRGRTGYLDTEITYPPFNAEWAAFHEILFSALEQAGVERLTESEMHELVPFVFDLEFDDDEDDDAEKDVDSGGNLVPVNVAQCLFGGS